MNSDTIVAGKTIAEYQLGMKQEELMQYIKGKYKTENRINTTVIYYSDFIFFVSDETQKVYQITVGNNFKGKFLGKIGIGSTLKDIEENIGKWNDELDVYIIPEHKGICFELKDIEDLDQEWLEDKMPIEWISVYEPKDNGACCTRV